MSTKKRDYWKNQNNSESKSSPKHDSKSKSKKTTEKKKNLIDISSTLPSQWVGMNKSACENMILTEERGRGRYLIAKKDIQEGTNFLRLIM